MWPILRDSKKRLAEREISLDVTPDANDLLGNLGYDPTLARRHVAHAPPS